MEVRAHMIELKCMCVFSCTASVYPELHFFACLGCMHGKGVACMGMASCELTPVFDTSFLFSPHHGSTSAKLIA